jgi:hypothetical protein
MSNDFKEPNNTTHYKIVEINNCGDIHYIITCCYLEKKYIFFGKLIEKKSLLREFHWDSQGGSYSVAWFPTIDSAQKTLNKICTGHSTRIVKEIEKYKT